MRLAVPGPRVWEWLGDPARMARCTPGLSSLEADEEGGYRLRLELPGFPAPGALRARLEQQEVGPYCLLLMVRADHPMGSVRARGTIELVDLETEGCTVLVEGEAWLGGALAVGQRVLQPISQGLLQQLFARLEGQLQESSASN